MKDVDVSIIIPVYNVRDYIDDCIDSVMNQKQTCNIRIECIFVDDRGNDNSMSIVSARIESYNGPIEFSIIKHEKNLGLSAARNTGISHARGKYLFFIDSDDYISRDCIYNLYSLSLKYPKAELIIGNAAFLYENGTFKSTCERKEFIQYYCDNKKDVQKTYFNLPVASWNKLIKRDWLLDNKLFFKEGIIYEDNHWSFKAYNYLTSYVISLDIPYSYFYRQRANSIMSSADKEKRILVYNETFTDAVKSVPNWDKFFSRKIIEYLFGLKVTSNSSILKQTVNDLIHCPQAKLSHRLLFSYLRINRPWLRVKVAKYLCWIIR